MLDQLRIYKYAQAYLEAQVEVLNDKAEEAEGDHLIGTARLLQLAQNQFEDELQELEERVNDMLETEKKLLKSMKDSEEN